MKRSLFGKLFSVSAAIMTAGFAILIGATVFALSGERERESLDRLESEAVAISDVINRMNSPSDYSGVMRRMATAFSNIDGSTVFFSNSSGYVFVCSDTTNGISCIHRKKMISDDILSEISARGVYINVGNFDGVYDEDHYTVGKPVYIDGNDKTTYVFVSAKIENKWYYVADILAVAAVPCAGVLAAMFIIVFFVTRSTVKPLKEISEATRQMANGDFSRRVSAENNDEIGDLAVSFNKMSESLESLDTMRNSFVTNVSHDLKTPMTTIGGFVDGILDGTIPENMQHKYLTIVSGEVRRLSNTVNTMLNLSKVESGVAQLTYSRVDLTDMVCRIIISFETMLTEKSIDVLGLDDAPSVSLECDENMMYQAVYNLIDNAVKFTQSDGYISFYFSENNSDVEMYIKNSGNGISPDEIDRIFERFYKTDKSRSVDRSGSGIGLHIVKTIVDKHGGEITARSVEGQYTEFRLKLPKVRE